MRLTTTAVVALAVIAGCATPQYQTSVRLMPPTDAQGQACVQGCEAARHICQAACKDRFQACARDIEPQVEARYAQALEQYAIDLKGYAAALRHYELQLRFEWLNRTPFRHPLWWDPWPGFYLPPPVAEPAMPTRDSVRAQLEKSACQADCGCLPAFDACFVGCGGQQLQETTCIKHCPPAQ